MKILSVLILSLVCTLVRAGVYEAGPTTGLTAQGGGVSSSNGSISAGAGAGSNSTVTISGTISTTFTWKRNLIGGIPDPSDDPPLSAVVVEDSTASATSQAFSGGGSASASNGLGSQAQNNSGPMYGTGYRSSYTCEGTRAKVVSGGETVTVTDCTVLATASVVNGSCSAGATYGVTVTPMLLSITGSVLANGKLYGEVGRRHLGNLSCPKPGITLANHQWNITGTKFERYDHGAIGYVEPFSGSDLNAPFPLWSWKSTREDDQDVQVTVDVLYNGVVVGSATAKKTFTVEVPSSKFEPTASQLSQIVNYGLKSDGNPSVTFSSIPVGLFFRYKVRTNSHFPPGKVFSVQLLSVDWESYISPAIHHSRTTEGRYDLDNDYPYRDVRDTTTAERYDSNHLAWWTEDYDTPGYWGSWPASVAVATSFELTLMYQPDADGAQPVPLKRIMWDWTGDNYSGPPATPILNGAVGPTNSHPVWTQKFANSH